MENIVNRLIGIFDNYYLANYLIGGSALCVGLKMLGIYELDENWYTILIMYYFAGMIASRLSSVLIEPILKKIKIISHADYSEFIRAEKKDKSGKLLEMSKMNSIYRTLCGTFFILLISETYCHWPFPWTCIKNLAGITVTLLLLCLFIMSYSKQTSYIKNRITIINSQ